MAQNKKFEMPFNEEAEIAVIGSIMIIGKDALKKIDHFFQADDFYEINHTRIYEAAQDLARDETEVDIITLSQTLRDRGLLEIIGGSSFLAETTNAVVTATRLVHYAKIVSKHATLRRIIGASRDVAAMTQNYQGDLDKLLVDAEAKINGVTRHAASQQNKLEIVDLQDYMELARNHREPEGTIRGLSSGLYKVDKMSQGFVPGELMIISGQTSHGKTQLSNNIMLAVAKAGKKVMFVTMEMTKQETAERFLLLTNNEDIGQGKIFLNMKSDLAYTDVTKLIERAKERGCELVVIDHLHYFSRSVENSTQEVSMIVNDFKRAAVKYELPIILICHVRKMPPKKHPTLEDLRDSSLIAQDADMVLIVWRDESPGASNPDEVEVVLWKNRNRQKKHRRDYLYAQGMKLVETDPRSDAEKNQVEQTAQTARLLGEKEALTLGDLDDEEVDFDIPEKKIANS